MTDKVLIKCPKLHDKVWVRCEVSRGMFETERTVVIESEDIDVSFFLNNLDLIDRLGGNRCLLEVTLLDQNLEYSLISLPKASIEKGAVVKVPNCNIVLDYERKILKEITVKELEETYIKSLDAVKKSKELEKQLEELAQSLKGDKKDLKRVYITFAILFAYFGNQCDSSLRRVDSKAL